MCETKFSIIIPVYNGEKTIERLLGSIICQKEFVEEILVCNDRSTDRTVEIVERYKYVLPIRVINVPEELNGYPGNARQCGVDEANADWIVFSDADDMLSFMSLRFYSAVIEENPDVKMVIGAFDQINAKYENEAHYVAAIPWVHGKAFNTEYIKTHNIRFPKNIFTHEDKYFVMRALCCLKAEGLAPIVSDYSTYFWMLRDDSIVHQEDYPLNSFGEASMATIEPLEICRNEYSLSDNQMQELFLHDALMNVFDMYAKLQCFQYVYNYAKAHKAYLMFLECYEKIKALFNISKEEIITLALQNPDCLQSVRTDSVRILGEYVEQQTFAQFIEEAEQNIRKAG